MPQQCCIIMDSESPKQYGRLVVAVYASLFLASPLSLAVHSCAGIMLKNSREEFSFVSPMLAALLCFVAQLENSCE